MTHLYSLEKYSQQNSKVSTIAPFCTVVQQHISVHNILLIYINDSNVSTTDILCVHNKYYVL